MKRRFLPSLDDHHYKVGCFATRWEGFVSPRFDLVYISQTKIRPLDHESQLPDKPGCYVLLYKAGVGSYYVAYIGSSATIRKRLASQLRGWGLEGSRSFSYVAIQVSTVGVACRYEDYLIRYYCPPWNTRFFSKAA